MGKKRIQVPVSHVDATWLGMDESTNPMVINGVMLLSGRIEYEQLVETLRARMVARFSRFSQRIVEGSSVIGRTYWESDPHFEIRSHVHHLALPDPGGTAELQRLISMLMSEPLDRTRPLWRFYLIDNVSVDDGGEGCAVYGRVHHAIGDGVALMRVILSFTDPTPVPRTRSATLTEPKAPPSRLPALAASPIRMVGRAAGALAKSARLRKSDPESAKQAAQQAASAVQATGLMTAAATVNLAKLAVMPKDRSTVYRGDLTPIKRIAWTEPISLDRVKAVGRATDSTVNDVLVASVAGGLRSYVLAQEGAGPDRDIRATIPVNLRPADAPLTLGNKFSLVFLSLPITVADPAQRLREVKKRMDALKRSPEPFLVYEILSMLGSMPGPISRRTSAWFASKASCILTNVPGPRAQVYFAGKRVDRMMFWVPQTRGVGIGISILSYAGDVTIGLMVDEALIPEPQKLVQCFSTAFEEVEPLAHQSSTGLAQSD